MQKPLVKMVSLLLTCSVLAVAGIKAQSSTGFSISDAALKDKIRGGWAGQTIGVTFGGPTEFRYNGTFIQDNQVINWYDGYLKKTMTENPGLYDDIYMDLTFVEVLERVGLNAPVDSFANAFAHAGYMLWHANQAARYNILNGIPAPGSGHWKNNPHADDIDFQIEADFAGLMSPGMPNAAAAIGDPIGHIMNYGDGWYGGVFVSAMYSLAFIKNDVNVIVKEALKTIPPQSEFYKCIADVIKWHAASPNDWKKTWFEIQKKWSAEVGCPDGIFVPFNIDAKVNAAYIVLGLLYGRGDFTRTLEISTRAGQDSDCNPSSAGGILGAMLGYDKIPARWKLGLSDIEKMDFKYTTMSLEKVYEISHKHALAVIVKNGGKVDGDKITIRSQTPTPVRFEQSFPGIYPVARVPVQKTSASQFEFEFQGTGFVVLGTATKKDKDSPEHVISASLWIDGKETEKVKLPTNFTLRRHELFWKYELPEGNHKVKIVVDDPGENYELRPWEYIRFSSKPNPSFKE